LGRERQEAKPRPKILEKYKVESWDLKLIHQNKSKTETTIWLLRKQFSITILNCTSFAFETHFFFIILMKLLFFLWYEMILGSWWDNRAKGTTHCAFISEAPSISSFKYAFFGCKSKQFKSQYVQIHLPFSVIQRVSSWIRIWLKNWENAMISGKRYSTLKNNISKV
jgi:hypothetical protein